MSTVQGHLRYLTEDEIRNLRAIALREHQDERLESPSELAIEIRVRTPAGQRGLRLEHDPPPGADTKHPEFSPGLALIKGFGQKQAHRADIRACAKRHGESVPHAESRIPYFFAALPDEYIDHFARYLPPSAGLLVWTLYRCGKTDMQTRVSEDTIVAKPGICENTLKRDMGLLIECKAIQRVPTVGTDFDGKRRLLGRIFKHMPEPDEAPVLVDAFMGGRGGIAVREGPRLQDHCE